MLSNSRHFLAIFRPCCNFSLAFHTVVSDMLKWFAGQTPIHFFTDHFSGPGRAVSPVLRVCVSEHLSGSTSYLKSWQSVCGVFLRVSGHSPPTPRTGGFPDVSRKYDSHNCANHLLNFANDLTLKLKSRTVVSLSHQTKP